MIWWPKRHMRWRIERDYQDLKQELGLDHYEGRGWRGFHHHASLSIAAYGFLVSERLASRQTRRRQKKLHRSAKCLPFPRITSLAAVPRAQRHVSDSITTIRHQLSFRADRNASVSAHVAANKTEDTFFDTVRLIFVETNGRYGEKSGSIRVDGPQNGAKSDRRKSVREVKTTGA